MGGNTKYQCCLYFINAITASFGAALVCVCIWALTLAENVTLPTWILPCGIVFGGIVMLVSCCGCKGASSAPRHKAEDSCNLSLSFYLTILFVSFVMQIILAVILLQLVGTMNTAISGDLADEAVQKFDNDFVEWTQDHPSKWIDTQNYFVCCGYQSTSDDTATGDVCSNSPETAVACRPKLLQKTKDQAEIISIVCIIFGFMELVALIASCCLCCGGPRQKVVQVANPKAVPMQQVVVAN